MADPKTPAERLTLARILARYETPKDFYEAFGISQATYSLHESGKRGIRPHVAEKYAGHLKNCSAAWLLTGQGKSPREAATSASPTQKRHEDAASFLLLYDRLAALTKENNEAVGREFGVMFRHYGYDADERGLVRLAFHIWQEVAEEPNDIPIPERVLKKIAWLDAAFDALKESLRKMSLLIDGPDAAH